MNTINVLAIVPYQEMRELLLEAAHSHPSLKIQSYTASLNEAQVIIDSIDLYEFDLVLARGYTAQILKQQLNLPVLDIEISLYDMLRLIKTAQERTPSFAVMASKAIVETAKLLIDILKIEGVALIPVDSIDEASVQITRLSSSGVRLIVGDLFAVQAAQRQGVESILITSGKTSIEKTLEIVENTYQNLCYATVKNVIYKNVCDRLQSSILIYDQKSRLIFDNNSLEPSARPEMEKFIRDFLRSLPTKPNLVLHKKIGKFSYSIQFMQINMGNTLYYAFHIYVRNALSKKYSSAISCVNPDTRTDTFPFSSGFASTFPSRPAPKDFHTGASISLHGAEGTGKSFFAKALWENGPYSASPMVVVECASLSAEQWNLEVDNIHSILHDLQYCIYFKNVDKLSPEAQEAVARFLKHTNFCCTHQIISSSSHSLNTLVNCSQFSSDLFVKLAEQSVYFPPLNECQNEIKGIIDICINYYDIQYAKEVVGLEPDALQALQNYNWSKNIDQLQAVIKQLVLTVSQPYISQEDVAYVLQEGAFAASHSRPPFTGTLEQIEQQIIYQVLVDNDMNQSRAAEQLGISRATLWRKLKAYYSTGGSL